jgi:hypothetical protein
MGTSKRSKWNFEVVNAVDLLLSLVKFDAHSGSCRRDVFKQCSSRKIESFLKLFDKRI